MALAPSGFKLEEGKELKFEKVSPGIYSVRNAYEGVYEYFRDKPIEIKTEESEDSSQASGK